MKAIFLLCFMAILFSALQGQNAKIEIRGTVSDINNKTPLVNVTIKIKDKNMGAISNELGQFYLKSDKLPVTLVFSYVGYETQEYIVKFEPLQPIIINMHRKTELLKGVVITSEKIDTVYHDQYYSVLDYELLNNGIILLIYKHTLNRSEIVFKEYDGNKISSINTLPGKPLRLYKDCLDNIHLFTRNTTHEIHFEKDKLSLYPAFDLDSFMEIMQYCELYHHTNLYYHETGYLDLINKYYSIDSNTKQQILLHIVLDQDKLDFLANNPENLSMLNPDFAPSLGLLSGLQSDKAILDQIRNIEVELRFNQMAYFPAIYAPMFKLGDSIVIFNHPNSTIDFFDESDSLVGSTAITYHSTSEKKDIQNTIASIARNNKWQKDVFIDPISKKAYTSFMGLNGTQVIKEIDLYTGQLVKSMKIPFPYVEKIKFHNGFMYYMYKGWGESQKKKIFRQQID